MKQSFNTSKLYYGFPIFILGYQDQNFEHNITTCSSSYSLGDWLVIGVGAEENAAERPKEQRAHDEEYKADGGEIEEG